MLLILGLDIAQICKDSSNLHHTWKNYMIPNEHTDFIPYDLRQI